MQNILKNQLKTTTNEESINIKQETLKRRFESTLRKIGVMLNMQQLANYK